MALYILGSNNGVTGLKLAMEDPDASIVLLQDATYMALNNIEQFDDLTRIMAIYEDTEKRGLLGRIPETIRLLQHDEFLELIMQEHVLCFP